MLVNLLSHYYRSGLRGSYRVTRLIDKFYRLGDVFVPTPYGRVHVDLTTTAGQGLAALCPTPEGEIIRRHARGVCYDIGANYGIYSLLMAGNASCVHAFEPNPGVFRHLQRTVEGHAITPHNVAVSDEPGTFDLFVPEDETMASLTDWTEDPDMSGIRKNAGRVSRSSCRAVTLDAYAREMELPSPNFVKIDVEGAEIKVFRGALETIRQHRPVIFFEVSMKLWPKLGGSAAEGYEILRSMGYRLFLGGEEIHSLDYDWDNVLAIPKETL
jgi:FkbM family methyltransferase